MAHMGSRGILAVQTIAHMSHQGTLKSGHRGPFGSLA